MRESRFAVYGIVLFILAITLLFNGCSLIPLDVTPTSITVGYLPDVPSEDTVFWVVLPQERAISLGAIPKGHFNPENHYKTWVTTQEFREAMKQYYEWRKQQKTDPKHYINTK